MNLIRKIKDRFKPVYYWFFFRYFHLLEILFPSKIKDPKKIPIIINSYNRLTCLQRLISALEQRGYSNIWIIDNASTYPPLLKFYDHCPYHVFRLKKNTGHLALWKTPVYKKFINDFYAYTDSDVVPSDQCPDDFMSVFLDTLKQYKFAKKAGFSLRIDNLPDHFEKKKEVMEWEKQYFEKRVSSLLYRAPIDTTFALYRPRAKGGSNAYIPMYRTASPYEAEHIPWYADSKNLTPEDLYYIKSSSTSTMWTVLNKELA
ncbi:MAG: hypothetical protein AB2L20_09825 [Mangrovibacterium sp.]